MEGNNNPTVRSNCLANDREKSKAGSNSGANTTCLNTKRTSSFCFLVCFIALESPNLQNERLKFFTF